jgi:Family of unknown function (DUF5317)
MIIVFAALLAILTVPLSGKSLRPLAQMSIRRTWLVWLSMVVQIAITVVPHFPDVLGRPLHLLTFALSAMFVWSNYQIPGTLTIAIGAVMNFAAIAANGGTIPASPWAWKTAGFPMAAGQFENSNVVSSPRLSWLGDVCAIPKSWPLSNVFSVGDVVIVIGIAYLTHMVCRRSTSASEALPSNGWPPPSVELSGVGSLQ